jgi:hypothetical protein
MIANFTFGNSPATFFRRVSWLKPDREDRAEAVAGEAAQGLLALGVVLGLEVAVLGAGLLLEPLGAGEDALVEGFVELAAEIVDDGGLHGRPLLRERRGRGEGEARQGQSEPGDAHRQSFPCGEVAGSGGPVARDDGMGRPWRQAPCRRSRRRSGPAPRCASPLSVAKRGFRTRARSGPAP